MTKPTLKQLTPILIILFGVAVFILLKATQPSAPPAPIKQRSWQVQTQVIKFQKLSPSLTLYGLIESPDLVQAAAANKSRVTSVLIHEGDPIQQGQLLLTLDERDFLPRLVQAQARAQELKALIQSEQSRFQSDKTALGHEKSLVSLEQSAVKRAKMLKNKKLGSTASLELAKEELGRQQLSYTNRQLALKDHAARQQQLEARLAYVQADVELAKLDLERSKIIAPFDGYIEKRMVTAGDQVKENQILLSFYSTEQLEVRAKIPATFQYEIQKSLYNKQTLFAFSKHAGTTLKLKLDRLSGIADSRGIDALFSITSGHEWVRPGSSISLSLHRPAISNVAVIPYAALYDNNRIYRVVNQKLEGLNIKIAGNYLEDGIEKLLVSNPKLQQNDIILVTHLPNAINGLKVETAQQP